MLYQLSYSRFDAMFGQDAGLMFVHNVGLQSGREGRWEVELGMVFWKGRGQERRVWGGQGWRGWDASKATKVEPVHPHPHLPPPALHTVQKSFTAHAPAGRTLKLHFLAEQSAAVALRSGFVRRKFAATSHEMSHSDEFSVAWSGGPLAEQTGLLLQGHLYC